MHLRPKNWAEFQHYKDRCPPWIKLHRDILINRDFMCLPLASKALAPLLWLLASESKDGSFDASIEELQFRLHLSTKDINEGLKPLIDKGFFVVASGVLAECLQVAIPETETETKKEERQKAIAIAKPISVSDSVWQDFVKHRKAKKAQVTQTVIDGIQRESDKAGWTLEAALTECVVRGWQSFKAEWVQPKTFAQQAADIARTTVPAKPGRDPTLVQIEQERAMAVPMPSHIRDQINQVLKKV